MSSCLWFSWPFIDPYSVVSLSLSLISLCHKPSLLLSLSLSVSASLIPWHLLILLWLFSSSDFDFLFLPLLVLLTSHWFFLFLFSRRLRCLFLVFSSLPDLLTLLPFPCSFVSYLCVFSCSCHCYISLLCVFLLSSKRKEGCYPMFIVLIVFLRAVDVRQKVKGKADQPMREVFRRG